jgi:hypothetical protein
MNELVVRIEADSADTQGDCGIAQIGKRHAGKADIDRLAFHVQALLRATPPPRLLRNCVLVVAQR